MSKKEELKHKYVREQSERIEIPDWEEVEFGFDEGWDAAAKEAALWFADRYQSNGSYLNANDIEDFRKAMEG